MIEHPDVSPNQNERRKGPAQSNERVEHIASDEAQWDEKLWKKRKGEREESRSKKAYIGWHADVLGLENAARRKKGRSKFLGNIKRWRTREAEKLITVHAGK